MTCDPVCVFKGIWQLFGPVEFDRKVPVVKVSDYDIAAFEVKVVSPDADAG